MNISDSNISSVVLIVRKSIKNNQMWIKNIIIKISSRIFLHCNYFIIERKTTYCRHECIFLSFHLLLVITSRINCSVNSVFTSNHVLLCDARFLPTVIHQFLLLLLYYKICKTHNICKL